MARKQESARECDNDRVQDQLAELMRADLIPNLNNQIVLCLRDIYRKQGPDAFEKSAERILSEVSAVVSRALGRYRLDRMLSRVEAVNDEIEMQAAAVPILRRPT